MPYVNRYFHKRDPVIPYKHSYDIKTLNRESIHENKKHPRHVVTYEYNLPQIGKNNNIIANTYNKTTNPQINPKYDYKKRYYSNNNEQIIKEIKSTQDFTPTSNVCAKIKSPSGKIHYCDIIDFDNNHFNIRFTPTEIGEHNVSVKQGHSHVAGSPFKIIVGSIESGALQDIHIYGMGIEGGYIDEINKFLIYLKNTGHGKLTVTIDGPSKATINLKEKENGTYDVEYKIPTSGSYLCSIKFNDKHVPGSPFKMNIQNKIQENFIYSNNADNINLMSMQNRGIAVGHPISLTLNQNGLNNNLLKAYVISPTNKKENVKIKSLENDQFCLRIEPKEKGLHKVHVLLNEMSIPGSPFEVLVGDVVAFGKGLFDAKVKEVSTFKLDTKSAEPGPLAVTFEGPSKVELNCFELEDGYEFTYCPSIPGDYILGLKYQNNHIQGSPFTVKIRDNNPPVDYPSISSQKASMANSAPVHMQSYPENVRCRGNGISEALIGRNNEFIVDASSGGAGNLYVAISGPTKPSEEINIKHIGGKRFQINYFVHELGKHLIFIRWNDKEIPGSPFPVYAH